MARYYCKTHGIALEIAGRRRKYSGLSWGGAPNCVLFTLKDPKPGKYGECEVVELR